MSAILLKWDKTMNSTSQITNFSQVLTFKTQPIKVMEKKKIN